MADKDNEGRKEALRVARVIGCSGVHMHNGKWMPCGSHEKLLEISRGAETGRYTPPRKSDDDVSTKDLVNASSVLLYKGADRKRKRSRRQDQWEDLREAPVRSIETMPDGSLVSGKGGTLSAGRVGGWMDRLDDYESRKGQRKRRTSRIRLEEVERRRAASDVEAKIGLDVKAGKVSGKIQSALKRGVVDGDGDGMVNDGKPNERPATPAEMAAGRMLRRGAGRAVVEAVKPGSSKKGKRKKRIGRSRPEGEVSGSESRRIARGLRSTARQLSVSDPEREKRGESRGIRTPVTRPRRFGRKAKKAEQELTPESRKLRVANQRAFPRAVTPPSIGEKAAPAAEIIQSGGSTADFFGISGRGIDQPGVSAERMQVYESIARAMVYGDADNPRELPVPEKPTMYMMGGGPGSGKSFLRQAGFFDVPTRDQAAHIDTDEGRMMLPEYAGMHRELGGDVEAAKAVAGLNHEEASYVARLATDMAVKGGHDVVLDSTGDGGPASFASRMRTAVENGYRVEAHYATVDIQQAINTAQKRAEVEGRGVDSTVIVDTHIDTSRAIIYGIIEGLFDKMTLTDNNDHDNPVVFAEMIAGKLSVYNVDMWDSFISKALMVLEKSYDSDYFLGNSELAKLLGDIGRG